VRTAGGGGGGASGGEERSDERKMRCSYRSTGCPFAPAALSQPHLGRMLNHLYRYLRLSQMLEEEEMGIIMRMRGGRLICVLREVMLICVLREVNYGGVLGGESG